MRIIDLLNRIANKEKLPERIKVAAKEFYICRKNTIDGDYDYQDDNATYLFDYLTEWDYVSNYLLKDVEVLEEYKEDKKYEDIEELDVEYDDDGRIDGVFMARPEVEERKLINVLIKNQKKIIEELKNLKEEK